jgi:hypothetical protein
MRRVDHISKKNGFKQSKKPDKPEFLRAKPNMLKT